MGTRQRQVAFFVCRADKNKVIILLSVDAGYIDMGLNLLETSLIKLGAVLFCIILCLLRFGDIVRTDTNRQYVDTDTEITKSSFKL